VKNRAQQPADRAWLPSPAASGTYRHWLQVEDSLTRRLQASFKDFKVANVSQHWAHPLPDEADLLGLRPNQTALIREVWLQSGESLLVFARSVLPRASLRGAWRDLGQLGSRPLGAVLFADRKVSRTPLTFCKLSCHHPISRRIDQAGLWARRSVFMRAGRAILVTETFLPGVLAR
jgi:chorismate--pyruvate lyase